MCLCNIRMLTGLPDHSLTLPHPRPRLDMHREHAAGHFRIQLRSLLCCVLGMCAASCKLSNSNTSGSIVCVVRHHDCGSQGSRGCAPGGPGDGVPCASSVSGI